MLSSPGMFNAPQEPSSILPTTDYIQPNLGHGLRVWWAFYWRTTLISGVLSVGAAYGLKQLYENTAWPARWIGWAMKLAPYLLFYGVAIFVMRAILHKKFRHFRIALSPKITPASDQVLKPTFNRVIRVWWMYSWRAALYSLVAWVVVSYPMALSLGLFAPSRIVMALFATVLGSVISAGVGLYVIYSSILDEDIGDFHVSLRPREVATATVAVVAPEEAVQRSAATDQS